MERFVGTVARGIRTPIITEGDDIVELVVNSVLTAAEKEDFKLRDRDVVSITESVIARAQGNYADIDDIARDIREKFGTDTIGIVFPIFSRNRFASILRGIAEGGQKIVLMLNYPCDEVGNSLIEKEKIEKVALNPWTDVLSEEEFRKHFGKSVHPFTGVDYISTYKEILSAYNSESFIIFSNNPRTILEHTKSVLVAEVHARERSTEILKNAGAEKIYGLVDLLNSPRFAPGYNEDYGLLGSNSADERRLKLFPRDCQIIVEAIQKRLKEKTDKTIEVMVYGDGAFKDPVSGIWELADPETVPAFTPGLSGTPNEVKLKYLADKDFGDLRGEELQAAINTFLKNRAEGQAKDDAAAMGTTPRRITDLLASLSDLTSGSGDKGTPVVLIQGYFDNYAK